MPCIPLSMQAGYATLSLIVSFVLIACGANSSQKSEQDRLIAKMNQRDYGAVVDTLEKKYSQGSNDKNTALILAEAYMGLSGAELFNTLLQVSATKSEPPLDLVVKLKCKNSSWSNLSDESVECIFERFMESVSGKEDKNVERAKTIVRESFSDIHNTSSDINFFAAYIELTSLFTHLRYIASLTTVDAFLGIKDSEYLQDKAFAEGTHNLKQVFDGAIQIFLRAKYSYKKIGTYTKSIDGKPIITYQAHELIFDDNFDFHHLFRFFLIVLRDESGQIDTNWNGQFGGVLSKQAPELIHFLRRLDYGVFQGKNGEHLQLMFKFESFLNKLLSEGASDLSSESILTDFWVDHPPEIIRKMFAAFSTSWETEDARPIRKFMLDSQNSWSDLEEINRRWTEIANLYSDKEVKSFVGYLAKRRSSEPQFLSLPNANKSFSLWKSNTLNTFSELINLICAEGIPDVHQPSEVEKNNIIETWKLTQTWLGQNF